MNIKQRLILLSFLQFFIWGSWLISTGGYLFSIKPVGFTGTEIGLVFMTFGFASVVMPALLGILADRWFNAEKILGVCHLVGAACLIWMSVANSSGKNFPMMFVAMLFNSMAYMPTIALNNTVSYRVLETKGFDVVKVFPPIRVWGTVGFIVAMWITDLTGFKHNNFQFYMAAAASVAMGLYSFTMPACPPAGISKKGSLSASLGLDAFVLFKQPRMFIFFLFSMLLGAALQITNTFGESFLRDFAGEYPNSFTVKYSLVMLSFSQISECIFILCIPFFLRKFGIKKVMIMSMVAWVFRFGLFAIGNPGDGFIFLFLSMMVYGMAFDFFNISGSLFVEREAPSSIRASAQGLFMMVTNGIGAILGTVGSGIVVDAFTNNKVINWPDIWLCFAGYALVLVLFFPLLFKYRHFPEEEKYNHRTPH